MAGACVDVKTCSRTVFHVEHHRLRFRHTTRHDCPDNLCSSGPEKASGESSEVWSLEQNNESLPPLFRIECAARKRAESAFTARTVTRSAVSAIPARCSNRDSATEAFNNGISRIASRRNDAFRDLDSTIVSLVSRQALFIGIAGDPPPEPRSIQSLWLSPRTAAAASGSTNRRSIAAFDGASSGRAV